MEVEMRVVRALLLVAAAAFTSCAMPTSSPSNQSNSGANSGAMSGELSGELATTGSAIVDGETDNGDLATVALVARRTDCDAAPPQPICTGVVIAPRAVLTAAHCLEVLPADADYEVFFGARLASGGRYVLVDGALRHPKYDSASHANDLALLRLSEDAPALPQKLPTAILEPSVVGSVARAVGFGMASSAEDSAGYKRTGATRISEVTATTFRATPSPAMTCAGDSGGPVFVRIAGEEQLIGITSAGDRACKEYAWNERVDAALEFIAPALTWTDELAPPPRLALSRLCEQQCEASGDCPSHLTCNRAFIGRCVLPRVEPGSFDESCKHGSECGSGKCARVASTGDDACRCYTACTSQGPGPRPSVDPPTKAPDPDQPQVGSSHGYGCNASRAPLSSCGVTALAFVFSSLLVRRTRRARRRLACLARLRRIQNLPT